MPALDPRRMRAEHARVHPLDRSVLFLQGQRVRPARAAGLTGGLVEIPERHEAIQFGEGLGHRLRRAGDPAAENESGQQGVHRFHGYAPMICFTCCIERPKHSWTYAIAFFTLASAPA